MIRNVTLVLGIFLMVANVALSQHTYAELELEDGGLLRYALVLPDSFDTEQTYPTLLALPPGPQTEAMVEAGLSRYWGDQASRRGWLVVSPIAPDGVMFFRGSERYIPELLAYLRTAYKIEGNRFHIAGNSNGGRSAFRIALDNPDEFVSLIVLPGFPPENEDFELLDRLIGKPVRLFVGGEDKSWIEPMERTRELLLKLEQDVTLTVLPGEGHVPASLDGDRFMNELTGVHELLSRAPEADPKEN